MSDDNTRIIGMTLAELEARWEAAAERGALRALAALPPPVTTGLLDGRALDQALGVSATTRNRFVVEGMPCELVGTRRRFDLAACRAWLAARGPKPTKVMVTPPKTPAEDTIDVSRALRNGGLRAVGSGR